MEIPKLKKIIEKTLNQNKAKNIVSINLKGKTTIADYMVVASGTSSKHIQSLSEILLKELENNGINKCKIEGRTSSDWKLIDAIDIIVHIFHPSKRCCWKQQECTSIYILATMHEDTMQTERTKSQDARRLERLFVLFIVSFSFCCMLYFQKVVLFCYL